MKMGKIGKLTTSILVLLISVSSFVYGQKPNIQLSVNVKPIEVGQMVAFTVKSNVNGNISINLPTTFTEAGVMNGMEQTMDGNGNMLISISYTQQGVFTKPGKYTITATVKDKNKTYKSNDLSLVVRKKGEAKSKKNYEQSEDDISNSNLKEAVFGIIEKSKRKLYEGEPLLLEAKIFSKINVTNIIQYQPFTIKGTVETFDVEKTDNVSINRENYKGNTFLTFSYGKQLVFPATSGKYIIKPFSMVLRYNNGGFFDRDLQFESNATYVDVLPLPKGAPKDFNGGVGKFSMSTNISKNTAKVGDILTYTIKVTGKGNMHAISKPKLNLPANLTLYGDPEIKEDIDYTDEGAEGEKTYKFFIKVLSGGKVELNPFSLSYFDPSTKKYVTLKEKTISLDLEGEIVASKVQVTDSVSVQGGEEVLAVPVSEEKLAAKESVPHSTLWIALLGALVIVLGAVIFFLLRKRKNGMPVNTKSDLEEVIPIQIAEVFQESNFTVTEAQHLASQGEYKTAYGVISKSLSKTIHQKLGDNSEIISKVELTERMKAHEISESIIEDYFWVIRSCQEAEYTIWDTHENWEEVVAKTKNILDYLK
jgi:LPXTG-motif cell wall-anchored protein